MQNTLNETLNEIIRLVGAYIPDLLGALAILIIGGLIAFAISSIVRRVLRRIGLDNRIARWTAGEEKANPIEIERGITKGVYYLSMLFVLVAFFQTLRITLITEPLNRLLNQVFQYTPQIVGAGILLLISWVVASVLRLIVSRFLSATRLEERLSSKAGLEKEKQLPLTKSFARIVYWLVLLLFLPAVLSTLGVEGLLIPVQGMLNKAFDFLPDLFTAGLILAVGWVIARIVQLIVTNILSAVGVDRLSEKAGLSRVLKKQTLSGILGLIIYILILIPVLIAALNALKLEAITLPASNILNMAIEALPNIFAVSLVLIIAYIVGRVISGLINSLLPAIGFNTILSMLGVSKGKESIEGKRAPVAIVGYLVLIAIVLFASIEASQLIGLESLADFLTDFTVFAGHIIFGLIIFGVGLCLANLASKTIHSTGAAQADLLAITSRIAIIVFAGAIALSQMGVASDIINLAFAMLLGAIAVAVAIAFGIGGKDIASRKLEEWLQSVKSKKES